MRIIPAIDIIDGKCVRLSKGDYSTQKIYNENPLDIAKTFQDHGVKYLHLVDLDGAKSNHIVNHKILEAIATNTELIIDFGGGLKSDKDLQIAFESGAHQITGGSIAVKQPNIFESWVKNYGPNKIILGADVKGELISINGWLETSDQSIYDFINHYQAQGISHVICTDINKDGMLQGPSFDLYQSILKKADIQLIASGGVSCFEELTKLSEIGCEATIIGKAIYENRIELKDIEQYIVKNKC